MDLKTYIQAARGNATALAAALDIPASYLSQMASGERAITEKRAALIEAHTSGQVKRWETRPDDWHVIWPELVGSEGAPDVPRAAEPEQQPA